MQCTTYMYTHCTAYIYFGNQFQLLSHWEIRNQYSLEQAWATFCQLRAALKNFQMTECLGNTSLYYTSIFSLLHNDNYLLHKSRLSLQFWPGSSRDDLLLISTAVLKIRVKSFFEFRNLNHWFQKPRISSRATQQHVAGCRLTMPGLEFAFKTILDGSGMK